LTDGTACDDDDSCTSAERCEAGVCQGQRLSSHAQLVSQLSSFGGEEDLPVARFVPPAVLVAPDAAVFTEPVVNGVWLRLVSVKSSGLSLLSSAFVPSPIQTGDATLWGRDSGTHLVALGAGRFALVMRYAGVRVYEVQAQGLAFLGASDLPEDGNIIAAFVRQNRIWLCGSTFYVGLEIGLDGVPAPLVSQSTPSFCNSLSASPNGDQLYVGSQKGVWRIDVSQPRAPVAAVKAEYTVPAESRVQAIQAWDGFLYVQTSRLWDGASDAFVLRASDFSEVARFTSVFGEETTLGAAPLLNGLLVQKLRYLPERGVRQYVAQLYAVDESGAHAGSEWIYGSDEGITEAAVPVQIPAAASELAILMPTREVVRVQQDGISPLRGREQGSLSRVRAAGARSLAVFGPHSSHLVDLTDPAAPTFATGGLFEPETSSFLRVGSAAPGRFTGLLNSPGTLQPTSALVTQLWTKDGAAPAPNGHFMLDGKYAKLDSDQGLLFQFSGNAKQGFSLSTFSLPATPMANEPLLAAETSALPTRAALLDRFAFDVSANALVIADVDAADSRPLLEWFEHREGEWKLVARLFLDASVGRPSAVAVRGDRALVISQTKERVDLVRRNQSQLELERTRDLAAADAAAAAQPQLNQVLGFDGQRVHLLGGVQSSNSATLDMRVFTWNLSDLSDNASYAVPDQIESAAHVGNVLAFGARTTLVFATPECSGPSP